MLIFWAKQPPSWTFGHDRINFMSVHAIHALFTFYLPCLAAMWTLSKILIFGLTTSCTESVCLIIFTLNFNAAADFSMHIESTYRECIYYEIEKSVMQQMLM